jgi:hypothetical protein
MPDSIQLINTMQSEQGKSEEFRESVEKSLVFVEVNGPSSWLRARDCRRWSTLLRVRREGVG